MIVTTGEPLVCFAADLRDPGASRPDVAYRRSLGGAEVNTAVGLARLGHEVALVARVGADPLGAFVRERLRDEGVSDALVAAVDDLPTGIMIKERVADADPWVRYCRSGSAATVLGVAALPVDAVTAASLVHATGVSLSIGDGPRSLALAMLEVAGAAGVPTSYDPNFRPALTSVDRARRWALDLLGSVTHFLCNELEAVTITGEPDAERALSALSSTGPRAVVVKRGAAGAIAVVDGERFQVPALPVDAPVDTVGAGDAFNAVWLSSWLGGLPAEQGLRFAAYAAACVVADGSDHGGFPTSERVAAEFGPLPIGTGRSNP